MKRIVSATVFLVAAGTSTVALTAEKIPQVAVLSAVLGCVGVAPDSARLACFDRTVAALAVAKQRQEIVVADKGAIREARRGLFGFSLPKLRLFGETEDGASQDRVDTIEAQVSSVGQNSNGGIQFGLSSGARWSQIDSSFVNRPKVGQTVVIQRGPVGGYTAKVAGGRAFRVRRLSE
ncbi:hypothetical protein [uncultured Novosphingobium sp.]|uniref:hypothetical protein n=1 Tax=uncultured Novosphingobium sp. TaxID=292277 RepID=UPI003748E38B